MNANDFLYLIVAIFSSLSVIGSFFIISIYAKFPALHCFSFRLIIILSIFDFIENLVLLIPTHIIPSEPNSICIIQAALIQFTSLGSVLWTGFICALLYIQVILKKSNLEYYFKLFLLITLTICIITTIIPAATNSYAFIGGSCGIADNRYMTNIFRYLFFNAFIWIVIIFISFAYWKIIRIVRSEIDIVDEMTEEGRALVKKLRLYPIAMVITYTPLTIVRILQSISSDLCPVWFNMLAYAFSMSNGLLNSIIYGFNGSVKKAILENFSVFSKGKSTILESFGSISI